MQHKTKNKSLVSETEGLSTQMIMEEALEKVRKLWETALSELKEEDRLFITAYFDGQSIKSLAKQHQISFKDAKALVQKLKTECIKNIRSKTVVRH